MRRKLQDIYNLVGEEAVDQQEKDWNAFAKNVANAVKKEWDKPKLGIVDV